MKANFIKGSCRVTALLMLLFSLAIHGDQDVSTQPLFMTAITNLKHGSMAEREQAINQLAENGGASLVILQALLDGQLFTLKTDMTLVIGVDNNQGYDVRDALTGETLGAMDRSTVNKINLTNKLRVSLRRTIGQLQLTVEDPAIRLAAVKDESALNLLKARLDLEKDPKVKQAIEVVFLLKDMNSSDKALRMKAIDALKAQNSLDVVNRLNVMVEKDEAGNFTEADADVRNAAKAALININTRLQLYSSAETIFFGLSLGAVLVLAAIGLAITFGVMGVINMAHGELMMLGAYTTCVAIYSGRFCYLGGGGYCY